MMKNIEDKISGKGYAVLSEKGNLRVYFRGQFRVLYHVPSGKIWSKYFVKDQMGSETPKEQPYFVR